LGLHLPEPREIPAADRENVRMILEMDRGSAQHVPLESLDGVQVDDGAAMDLRELVRIEALHELFQGRADHVATCSRHDLGVFVASLEIENLRYGKHARGVARAGVQPGKMRRL